MDPSELLASLPDPLIVVDDRARLLWANRTAEDALGWRLEELQGEPVAFLCHPDDLPTALASLASVQGKEVGTSVEIRVRDRTGSYRCYEVRGRNATDVPGIGGVVLGLRDVSDRGGWEVAGGDPHLYQAVLDHAPGITMLLGPDGTLRGASRALTSLVGRSLESSLGHHLREFVSDADTATVEAELALVASERGQRSFEATFTTESGVAAVPMGLTVVNLLDDPSVAGLVVSAVDITALTEARERLHHLAHHDPLTDLPNRVALIERLQDALAAATRRGSGVSVIYCDLDGFKAVNDNHGHLAGDAVLREVANRLLTATRASDTVARIGGDEFVILVEDGSTPAVLDLRERIHAAIVTPITLPSGEDVAVRVTTGLASTDGSGVADELLARADAAMYGAKPRSSED